LVYTATLSAFSLFLFPWKIALIFAGVNGALHWVVDFFTSKLTAVYKDDRRTFFLIVGLDQFIHSATLILVWDQLMVD
jgi:hypothetical protein